MIVHVLSSSNVIHSIAVCIINSRCHKPIKKKKVSIHTSWTVNGAEIEETVAERKNRITLGNPNS